MIHGRDREELGSAETERATPSGATDIGAAETQIAAAPAPRAKASSRREPVPVVGERIGRFTVLEVLGRGGMGVVVSAYDPRLDRRVAIKLVSSRAADEKEHRDRLLLEARAMAKVRHPNVVAVHEVGEHEGQIYVAMEQVDGGTLGAALAAERDDGDEHNDWRRVVELFVEAGRGLAAAHAQGMIHRDFKPDNVFVDASGRVLVGDFGLVRALRAEPSERGEDVSVTEPFTRADVVVGTPAYMAPEQHKGEAVDASADQFAFCVTLYQALYGELPFAGDTRLEYLGAAVRGEVRAPSRARKVPAWLRQVLRRGLSADPRDRFASMEALLAELGDDSRGARQLGRGMRVAIVVIAVALTLAWSTLMVGFDLELSYGLSYASNGTFLGLMLGLAWVGRRAFTRTAFNRRILAIGVAVAGLTMVLAVGGHLLEIPPPALGVLHLFAYSAAFLYAAILLDLRLGVAAGTYLAGFLSASVWPPLYLALLGPTHLVGALMFYLVVTSRSPRTL